MVCIGQQCELVLCMSPTRTSHLLLRCCIQEEGVDWPGAPHCIAMRAVQHASGRHRADLLQVQTCIHDCSTRILARGRQCQRCRLEPDCIDSIYATFMPLSNGTTGTCQSSSVVMCIRYMSCFICIVLESQAALSPPSCLGSCLSVC